MYELALLAGYNDPWPTEFGFGTNCPHVVFGGLFYYLTVLRKQAERGYWTFHETWTRPLLPTVLKLCWVLSGMVDLILRTRLFRTDRTQEKRHLLVCLAMMCDVLGSFMLIADYEQDMFQLRGRAEQLRRAAVVHFELYRNPREQSDSVLSTWYRRFGAVSHWEPCSTLASLSVTGIHRRIPKAALDCLLNSSTELSYERDLRSFLRSHQVRPQFIRSAMLAHYLSFVISVDANVLRDLGISNRLLVWELQRNIGHFKLGPVLLHLQFDFAFI